MSLRIFFFLVLGVMFGCGKQQSNQRQPGEKIKIVTTTGMIGDAVKEIAGNHADVVSLMGAGVDPHLYKATHGDLERLTEADIIFYNGLHLEGKMGEVFEKLSRTKPVIAVGDALPEEKLRKVPGFQGAYDPHIWFDVKIWSEALGAISTHLQEYDSAHARDYVDNHRQYLGKLDSLDKAVRQSILEIPENQRVLITAHDAFGYFGDAYNIEVRGLQGISTLSEFGLRDVTELVDFIIARKVKAIFVETSVSQRSIEAVVEGCRQKGWNVTIGGRLFSDAMGERGTPEGTYIGMVNANVKTIVESLR
ncbi:MAG TPA: zinc ABC transporter substrate-binding protein [Chryseosolibacter sp.]|nr:zinc ABC transporter substrate-binding protein [Chryseosolibacter sp.]